MIDIHCHLLPNVDDGSSSWEESLKMVGIAAKDGIEFAYATPHWIQGTRWSPNPQAVKSGVDELNSRIEEEGIDFKVLPGMEIGIAENLAELIDSSKVLPLGDTNCVLIEIPFMPLPLGFGRIIDEIKAVGVTPVLAHPERNMYFQQEPGRIAEYVDDDTYVQVTASSLWGVFGEPAKQCAMDFARMGYIHALASDAHSAEDRPPVISKGFKVLEGVIGFEKARKISQYTAQLFG
ncbi:MAG: CpsB/CapC family capsule biosynthesis tyrosine phosphatase [Thermodesulfobacteriota bacterium]